MFSRLPRSRRTAWTTLMGLLIVAFVLTGYSVAALIMAALLSALTWDM